jgi:hypothetical protein
MMGHKSNRGNPGGAAAKSLPIGAGFQLFDSRQFYIDGSSGF